MSNYLLQKVLKLVLLTATVPNVYITPMTNFLSDSYNVLDENIDNLNSIKLKIYLGENFIDCCDEICFDAEHLERARDFNYEHLV